MSVAGHLQEKCLLVIMEQKIIKKNNRLEQT